MATDPGHTTQQPQGPSTLGRWLRVAAAAGGLLLLSEALWLWQTWPVRELLDAPLHYAPQAPVK